MSAHRISYDKLYRTYCGIKARCENKNNPSYDNIGALGITMCSKWSDYENGFYEFKKWSLENGYKEGKKIERIDKSKPYGPDNCQWIDKIKYVIYLNGKQISANKIEKEFGINKQTIYNRLNNGKSIDDLIKKKKEKKRNGTNYE